MQGSKTTHGLDGQHQYVDKTHRERVNQNDRGQRFIKKVCPWCGQPSDRGWLKNRTDLNPRLYDLNTTGFPGLIAEHLYAKFGGQFLRYCAEKQTHRQTAVITRPQRVPSTWVTSTGVPCWTASISEFLSFEFSSTLFTLVAG